MRRHPKILQILLAIHQHQPVPLPFLRPIRLHVILFLNRRPQFLDQIRVPRPRRALLVPLLEQLHIAELLMRPLRPQVTQHILAPAPGQPLPRPRWPAKPHILRRRIQVRRHIITRLIQPPARLRIIPPGAPAMETLIIRPALNLPFIIRAIDIPDQILIPPPHPGLATLLLLQRRRQFHPRRRQFRNEFRSKHRRGKYSVFSIQYSVGPKGARRSRRFTVLRTSRILFLRSLSAPIRARIRRKDDRRPIFAVTLFGEDCFRRIQALTFLPTHGRKVMSAINTIRSSHSVFSLIRENSCNSCQTRSPPEY